MVRSLRLLTLFIGIVSISCFLLIRLQDLSISLGSINAVEYLENSLTSYFKQPVFIKNISFHWRSFHPVLEIEDFKVMDVNNKPDLDVKKLEMSIDLVASLLKGKMIVGDFSLQDCNLNITELGEGKFDINHIKTLEADLNDPHSKKLAMLCDLFLSKGIKDIKNLNITWYDKQGRLMLPISKIQVGVQGNFLVHRFKAEASVWHDTPVQIKGTFYGSYLARQYVRSILKIKASEVKLNGYPLLDRLTELLTLKFKYSDFKNQTLPGNKAMPLVSPSIHLKEGTASFEFTVKTMRHSLHILGKSNANNLVMMSPYRSFRLNQFKSQVDLLVKPQFLQLGLYGLQLRLNGNQLPIQQFSFKQRGKGESLQQTIKVDHLPLLEFSSFAKVHHLFSEKLNNYFKHLQPRGEIQKLHFRLDARRGEISKNVTLSGKLIDLSWQEWGKIPGISHLSGKVDLFPGAGQFLLDAKHLRLSYSPVFRKPISIISAKAQIRWRRQAGQTWEISTPRYRAWLPEGHAHGYFKMRLPNEKKSLEIHTKSHFELKTLRGASTYYPINLLSPKLVHWLDTSIKDGQLSNGIFTLDGAMNEFPFVSSKGKFLVMGDLQKGRLNYRNGWPELSDIVGRLRFEGKSMSITASNAKMLEAKAAQVKAEIPDLAKPILSVEGQLSTSPGSKILLSKGANPLAAYNHRLSSFQNLQLAGEWQSFLKLTAPLDERLKTPTLLNGRVNLHDISINTFHGGLLLQKLKGDLTFTNQSVNSNLITGLLFSQPLQLSFNTDIPSKGQTINVNVDSAISISDLQKLSHKPLLNYFEGTTPFHASLLFNPLHSNSSLVVISDLEGIKSSLPKPFAKQPNAKLLSRLCLISNQNEASMLFNVSSIIKGKFEYKPLESRLNLQEGEMKISSPELTGLITIPRAYPALPMRAQMQSVNFQGASEIKHNLSPKSMPYLDLSILHLLYKEKTFKNVRIRIQPKLNDLQINELSVKGPNIRIFATGLWKQVGLRQSSYFKGRLMTPNIGSLLNQWHMTDNVVKGEGSVDFDLRWLDVPWNPRTKTLDGAVKLQFNQGRIVRLGSSANFGMGIGRVLNLLSLQTLSRRLRGDFSDLTESGFSFDELRGALRFNQGNLYTDNTAMEGTVGKVKAKGRIGLMDKDYDLRLIINPNVTSSLPVVATLTAGPVVGAVTWLVDKILSRQVKKITEIHYNVTGAWDKPNLIIQPTNESN